MGPFQRRCGPFGIRFSYVGLSDIIPVGTLTYSRQGTRENTLLVYDDAWLENDNRF
jgi:hypothetical protein